MSDNLFLKDESREGIIRGIEKCRLAVGITMGSAGWNSIVESIHRPGFEMINDGWKILSSIKLSDPLEEIGRKILLDAVTGANKASGDGSSGTTVLTSAIISKGIEIGKAHNVSPLEIKNSLEECLPLIESSLRGMSVPVGVDNVGNVCSISAQDEKIGELIQEIYQKIGKDGIIHWDISNTTEDRYSIGRGIAVNGAGFVSAGMCDIEEKSGRLTSSARLNKVKTLIVKHKLSTANELEGIASSLSSAGEKELLIFCDDIDPVLVGLLVNTRIEKGFRMVVVKMPVLWKDEWYEDLALATGGSVVSHESGITMRNLSLSNLGFLENVVVERESTFLDGTRDLDSHIKSLQGGTDAEKLRASRLNVSTARLYIGANSETALSYRRMKVEDAINAGWQALHGGIISGGGVALASIKGLPDTIGGEILSVALKAPFYQIAENAGMEMKDWEFDGIHGVDTRTKKKVKMMEEGIVDPANVVINSCKNAISVAATALTAGTVVLLTRGGDNVPLPENFI